jgi:subtilisin family serine protease
MVYDNPQPEITGDTMICVGCSGELNAGSGFYSYLWSTEDTTPIINIKAGGIYYVTVTDQNNCEGIDSQFVHEQNAFSPIDTPITYNDSLPECVMLSGKATWQPTGMHTGFCPDVEILGDTCFIDSWSKGGAIAAVHHFEVNISEICIPFPDPADISNPEALVFGQNLFFMNAGGRVEVNVCWNENANMLQESIWNSDSIGFNVATSAKMVMRANVGAYALSENAVIKIRFMGIGAVLHDDAEFYYDSGISNVVLTEDNSLHGTFPLLLGTTLDSLSVDYAICDSSVYNRLHVVVYWAADVRSALTKQEIRDSSGVDESFPCTFNPRWELWILNNYLPSLFPWQTMQSIGTNERVAKARSKAKVNEADPNWVASNGNTFANFIEVRQSLIKEIQGVPANTSDDIVIASIDTGYDTVATCRKDLLYSKPEEDFNNGDTDQNGVTDDKYGANLVDVGKSMAMNNFTDNINEGHGTAVSGVIADKWNELSTLYRNQRTDLPKCKILPIRAFSNGISDLFTLICSILYAAGEQADVMCISAGWYAADICNTAIRALELTRDSGIVMVVSAGNDFVDVNAYNYYFAVPGLSNMICVGSATDTGLSSFSNYSPTSVNIATYGDSIICHHPGDCRTPQTLNCPGVCLKPRWGTSFSAPVVAAMAAFAKAAFRADSMELNPEENISIIKESSVVRDDLLDFIEQGRFVNLSNFVLALPEPPASMTGQNSSSIEFYLAPNPAHDLLIIQSNVDVNEHMAYEMYDAIGGLVRADRRYFVDMSIDVSDLRDGVYFLLIKSTDTVFTLRFFKG